MPDVVTLLHADPGDLADYFRSQLDLMRGNDVAGSVENHIAFAAGGNHGRLHANDIDFGGGVQLAEDESRGSEQDEYGDAGENPANGPGGRFVAPLGAVDAQAFEFGVHVADLNLAQRGQDLLSGSRSSGEQAAQGANHEREYDPP